MADITVQSVIILLMEPNLN